MSHQELLQLAKFVVIEVVRPEPFEAGDSINSNTSLYYAFGVSPSNSTARPCTSPAFPFMLPVDQDLEPLSYRAG